MSKTDDIQARLARLEARHEISALITRYAIACDEHDLDTLELLFTADAEFHSPNGLMTASGRKAILDMFDQVLSVRGPGYHWTHDHIISFDRDAAGSASGIVLGHAETTPHEIQSIAAMRYDDEYRLDGGAWRFSRREIRFLYYVPISEYSTVLKRTDRVAAGKRRLDADYPEQLKSWQAFDARQRIAQR